MPSGHFEPGAQARHSLPFLVQGGEMGERFRAKEWAQTPLGPAEGWPESLKALVNVMLGAHQPMFVAWGPERIMLYNDGYAPMLGQRHPDALGKTFEEVWYDIIPEVGPIMDRAYAGEPIYMEDISFVMHRHGYPEQAHFSFSYTPVRAEGGGVAGVFCACAETTDSVLTDRRRVEEAQNLRRLFDNAPGFMAVATGPDHVFQLVNASYMQLVGHRDLIGKPVREAVPEVGQGFFDLLDRVYQSGEPFTGKSVPVTLQRTPGAPLEERRVDFVFQPMVDGKGAVTGIFAEGYDVTDWHLAEQTIRESEERFRLIADSAPVPMWVTALDRKRTFVNRAYVEFLEISYEEAVDFDWRTIIHPDDADRIIAESLAGEASLEPFTLEARYRRPNGEYRWLRSRSQPRWGPKGEHLGFIGVAHDITEAKDAEAALRAMNETLERRVAARTSDLSSALERLQAEVGERMRAEAALRQAQKMEAVGQLTGGIAHDFNNLLTPILGGLEIIAMRVEDARLKRIAETALESTRRGAKLTGQLLAFSRIQRISMAPVDVNRVIERMDDLLRHTIGSAVRIGTALSPEATCGICDANQLENAVLNLAINARDAMPEGGTLTISTGRSEIGDSPDVAPGNYIFVSVADTGIGMSEEVLARATEPFFSTKPVGKGTGLGLAQVYGIARQAGGTLRIESEPGRGTTIHLLLPEATLAPVEEIRSASAARALEPEPAASGATILLIDDDSEVRDFIRDCLQGLGHTVVSAEDGEEGLRELARSEPDLVLLDYAMPAMHGADVAREIRKTHPSLPIVFVTGYAESEQMDAAVGGDGSVLRKPFSVGELAAVLEDKLPRPGR
jgi:PAS domain S-box-containing protein